MTKRIVSLFDVRTMAVALVRDQLPLPLKPFAPAIRLYGVPRGGIPAAFALAAAHGHAIVQDDIATCDYIVDDIWDSGATAARYKARWPHKPFLVLFDKRHSTWAGQWLVMPWEVTETGNDKSADEIVVRLLEYIGDDPTREGLAETPKRVLAAWREWATGYNQDPAAVLKTFTDGAAGVNELVVVHNIPVVSKCEHHLADVMGIAHVGYIPNGKIVGLSKLARLVDMFARRLQVQERLTNQIADALIDNLDPLGVGVLITASHACMSTRGVKIHNSVTTTSAMRGALLNKPEARAEFLALCNMAQNHRGAT